MTVLHGYDDWEISEASFGLLEWWPSTRFNLPNDKLKLSWKTPKTPCNPQLYKQTGSNILQIRLIKLRLSALELHPLDYDTVREILQVLSLHLSCSIIIEWEHNNKRTTTNNYNCDKKPLLNTADKWRWRWRRRNDYDWELVVFLEEGLAFIHTWLHGFFAWFPSSGADWKT